MLTVMWILHACALALWRQNSKCSLERDRNKADISRARTHPVLYLAGAIILPVLRTQATVDKRSSEISSRVYCALYRKGRACDRLSTLFLHPGKESICQDVDMRNKLSRSGRRLACWIGCEEFGEFRGELRRLDLNQLLTTLWYMQATRSSSSPPGQSL